AVVVMARDTHRREDLLAEATALVQRASLHLEGAREPVVVGFRRDNGASWYFGDDPVYQFNSAGQLRRAFVSCLLYKAEAGRIIELRRTSSETAVELVLRMLSDAEAAEFLGEVRLRLTALGEALVEGRFELIGQVPRDANVVARARDWLEFHAAALEIAPSPRAG